MGDTVVVTDLRASFVAMFAASVLLLVGIAAAALGLALLLLGLPAAWLAWSGGMLALGSIAARYLLARTMRPVLNRISAEGITMIYMPLLNDGTDAWRPVEAIKITDLGYMVTENAPPDEEWAFQPGHILRCEEHHLSDGSHLVAVAKAT